MELQDILNKSRKTMAKTIIKPVNNSKEINPEFKEIKLNIDEREPITESFNSYDFGNTNIQQTQFENQTPPKGMPQEIFESFIKTPPAMLENYSDNILNENELKALGIDKVKRPQRTAVNTQPTASVNIDYEYLKFIIDNSVKKALEEQKENSLNTIRIGKNKIYLTDTKGNLFEAPLKFIKNINED